MMDHSEREEFFRNLLTSLCQNPVTLCQYTIINTQISMSYIIFVCCLSWMYALFEVTDFTWWFLQKLLAWGAQGANPSFWTPLYLTKHSNWFSWISNTNTELSDLWLSWQTNQQLWKMIIQDTSMFVSHLVSICSKYMYKAQKVTIERFNSWCLHGAGHNSKQYCYRRTTVSVANNKFIYLSFI